MVVQHAEVVAVGEGGFGTWTFGCLGHPIIALPAQ